MEWKCVDEGCNISLIVADPLEIKDHDGKRHLIRLDPDGIFYLINHLMRILREMIKEE